MPDMILTEEQFEEAVLEASRREMLRLKRSADRAIAKARADGVEEGRREVNSYLKAISAFNGTGPKVVHAIDRLMKAEDEIDSSPSLPPDLADAYEAAAYGLVIEAKENDEDPGPRLAALASLLDDPEGLAEALSGLDSDTVAKAIGQVVLLKAWDESKHPRAKDGKFISKDAIADAKGDPEKADALRARVKPEDASKLEDALSGKTDLGRTKKGEAKEGAKQRAASKEDRLARVKEIRHSISRRTHTADDLRELAEHLPHLSIAELRKARGALEQDGASFGGARRRDAMVAALVEHAKRIAAAEDADAIDPLDFGALVDYESTGTPREALSRWQDAPMRAGMEESVERGGEEEAKPAAKDTPVDREAVIKRLTDAWDRGEAGDQDPLGQAAAGPPENHSEIAPKIRSVLDGNAERGFAGMPISEIYEEVGGGMSKEDFNRSLIAMHNAGQIRLTGWTRDLPTIPDPELVPMISSRYMGYAKPGSTPVEADSPQVVSEFGEDKPAAKGLEKVRGRIEWDGSLVADDSGNRDLLRGPDGELYRSNAEYKRKQKEAKQKPAEKPQPQPEQQPAQEKKKNRTVFDDWSDSAREWERVAQAKREESSKSHQARVEAAKNLSNEQLSELLSDNSTAIREIAQDELDSRSKADDDLKPKEEGSQVVSELGGEESSASTPPAGEGTTAAGRTVQFIPHPNQRSDETTILVDPRKFEQEWVATNPAAIHPGGKNSSMGRLEAVKKHLETGRPMQAPRATLGWQGKPEVIDGRHRVRVLTDEGIDRIALTVPKDEVKEFVSRYGADSPQVVSELSDDYGAVSAYIESLNAPDPRTGITPLIPQIYDKLKEKHPNLTEPEFHDILKQMAADDRLTLQAWNDIGTGGPGAQAGIPTSRFPAHPRHGGPAAWIQTRMKVSSPADPILDAIESQTHLTDGQRQSFRNRVAKVRGQKHLSEPQKASLLRGLAESAKASSDIAQANAEKKARGEMPGVVKEAPKKTAAELEDVVSRLQKVVDAAGHNALGSDADALESAKRRLREAKEGKSEGSASPPLATRLKDTIEATSDPSAVSDQEVEDLLAEVAKLPQAEQTKIAREVTGRGGRTSKQALQYLRADLTAVKRALESQKV